MAESNFFKANWDVSEPEPQSPTIDDYSANTADAKSLLKDPRFLSDVRQYYREHHKREFSSDEEMVDQWYEDRNWADLNTIGATMDAVRSQTSTPEQRMRHRRLENVWRALPSRFWDADQRWTAIGDVAEAVVLDPLNLIPGLGAMRAGAHAARLALMGQKTGVISGHATRAALAKGAKTGAISEAAISGVQEAAVDTAHQLRDVDLDFQDEFDFGRLGKHAALGAAVGGGIGSVIGVTGGAIGRMGADKQIDQLRTLGYTDAEIAQMGPALSDAINPIGRAATRIEPDEEGMVPRYTGEAGQVLREERRAMERGDRLHFRDIAPDDRSKDEIERNTFVTDEPKVDVDPDSPEAKRAALLAQVQLDPQWAPKLDKLINNTQSELNDAARLVDQTPEDREEVTRLKALLTDLKSLRATEQRLQGDVDEILPGLGEVEGSAYDAARAKLRKLTDDVTNLQAAINRADNGEPVGDIFDPPTAAAGAPGAPDAPGAPGARGETPDVSQDETSAAADGLPWSEQTPAQKTKGEKTPQQAAQELGITDENIADWITATGGEQLSKAGRIGLKQVRQVRKWKEESGLEVPWGSGDRQKNAKALANELGVTDDEIRAWVVLNGPEALSKGGKVTTKQIRAVDEWKKGGAASEEAAAEVAPVEEGVPTPETTVVEPPASSAAAPKQEIIDDFAEVLDQWNGYALPPGIKDENKVTVIRGLAAGIARDRDYDQAELFGLIDDNIDQFNVSRGADDVDAKILPTLDFTVGYNESQKRKFRDILRKLKEDPANAGKEEIALQSTARTLVDQNSAFDPPEDITRAVETEEGTQFAERQARRFGTSDAIERASTMEGAGVNPNTGRVQSVLKRGRAVEFEQDVQTGKWRVSRSVTSDGINRQTESVDPARLMGRAEAVSVADYNRTALTRFRTDPKGEMALIKQQIRQENKAENIKMNGHEINQAAQARFDEAVRRLEATSNIIRYTADEGEKLLHTQGGPLKIARRGDFAYWDALQNRAFASEADALNARGTGRKVDVDETTATDAKKATGVTADEFNAIIERYGKDPEKMMELLEKLKRGERADLEPEVPVTPASSAELVAVARYTDPETGEHLHRMLSNKQVDQGRTVNDMIGQQGGPKADMNNWEVRYASRDTIRTEEGRRQAFDAADPAPGRVESAAGSPHGGATGYGQPVDLTTTEADNIKVPFTKGEIELLRSDATFVTPMDSIIGTEGVTAKEVREEHVSLLLDDFFDSGNTDVSYRNLVEFSFVLETQPWRNAEEMGRHIQALELINQKLADANPNGYVLPNTARVVAVNNVGEIFARHAPEEIALARNFINRLGGDKTQGPVFKQGDDGFFNYSFTTEEQTISLDMPTGSRAPHSQVLYHEVAHWAYQNILTPKDRVEFWRAMQREYTNPDGTINYDKINDRSVPTSEGMRGYGEFSPQEFFADQFSMWATQRRSDGKWDTPGYWERVATYVKAIFDRYYDKKAIDPNLEPLFSKILPDEDRHKFKHGFVTNPETEAGQITKLRYQEIDDLEIRMHKAILSDEDHQIFSAASEIRNYLAGRFAFNKDPERGPTGRNFYKGISPTRFKILRHRLLDLNQILSGQVYKSDDEVQGFINTGKVPEQYADIHEWSREELGLLEREVAEQFDALEGQGVAEHTPTSVQPMAIFRMTGDLIDLFEGAWEPKTGTYSKDAPLKGWTNLEYAFKTMRRELSQSYHIAEGSPLDRIPDSQTREKVSFKRKKGAKSKKARARKTAESKAQKTVAVPKKKRRTNPQNKASVNETGAASLRGMGQQQLADEFNKHEGTPRGDQIAVILDEKMKAFPVLEHDIPVRQEIYTARTPELADKYLEAWRANDFETEEQIAYEISRRLHNKKAKSDGNKKIHATVLKFHDVRLQRNVDDEIAANTGVSYDDGIPAQAPARVKAFLQPITHRDPVVQTTARTMMYRMLNLAGKAVDKTDEINVLSVKEVARLANVTPEGSPNAVFSDFRGGNYNKLRSDLRRMAVGLNKGEVTPIEVMHEISHAVLRSGGFPKAERRAIVEAFDAADDELRERAFQRAGKNYPDENSEQIKEIAAEEWFVEGFSQYLARRVSKNDAFKMSEQGEMEGILLRGDMDRAIDRLIEYVAYVTNGLIGRNDIKQTYRRMMFYGDVFEKQTNPILDVYRGRAGIPAKNALEYAEAAFRYAPENRKAAMSRYVKTGNPVTDKLTYIQNFWHGTPWGQKFDRNTYPDVVLKPSVTGAFGRGVYLATTPGESQFYSTRPTGGAWDAEIRSKNLSPERESSALDAAQTASVLNQHIGELRAEVSSLRGSTSDALLGDAGEVNAGIVDARIRELETEISGDLEDLNYFRDLLRDEYGVQMEPEVMPLVVRSKHTARFDDTIYESDDGFVVALVKELADAGTFDEELVTKFFNLAFSEADASTGARRISGRQLYGRLLGAGIEEAGLGRREMTDEITDALERLGYDSMFAMHHSRDPSSSDAMTNNLIVFDSKNVRHIDADVFDEADDRLYYSDFQDQTNVAIGDLANDLSGTGKKHSPVTMPLLNVPPQVSSGMDKIANNKALDPGEIEALRKASGVQLRTNSSRMIHMGFRTVGEWFKDFYPEHHRRFAGKYFDMKDQLLALPDAPSALKAWGKRIAAPVSQRLSEQPQSWRKIARALRRGSDSDAFKRLTTQERQVANSIWSQFQQERRDLVEAGVWMGDRGDEYFPQVWSSKEIAKNGPEFRAALADYFVAERRAHGMSEDELARMRDTEDFQTQVNKIYRTLADNENEGLAFPDEARSVSAGSENIDFSRMIELDKHPEALAKLEPFLEDDLDFILTKYFEASTRKQMMVERFGLNNHGLTDYNHVMMGGKEALIDLLTTARVYRKSVKAKTYNGNVEVGDLVDTTPMPYQANPADADPFIDLLLKTHLEHGRPAAKQLLTMIAPHNPGGGMSHAFSKRSDAILDALDDSRFEGQHQFSRIDAQEYDHVNKMMDVYNKRPLGESPAARSASRAVRTFNNVTLLGYTMLTSLGDTILPTIRSGSLSATVKGYAKMTDPHYRKMIRNTGVAIENIMHERMIHGYGGTDSKLSAAFFNASLLTPWTDMQRKMSSAVGHQSFVAEQARAYSNYNPAVELSDQTSAYKQAYRYLKMYGLEDYLPSGSRKESFDVDDAMNNPDLQEAVIKFTNDAVFAPNADDVPVWGQMPGRSLIMQLKTFPLMMGRLGKEVLFNDARLLLHDMGLAKMKDPDSVRGTGNPKRALAFLVLGPAFGYGTLNVKDIVQGRGGEENRQHKPRDRDRALQKLIGYSEKYHGDLLIYLSRYMEGLLLMGGLGLVADIFHAAIESSDNAHYGTQRMLGMVSPSVSTATGAWNVGVGAAEAMKSDGRTGAKRTALNEAFGRVPFMPTSVRRDLVDDLVPRSQGDSIFTPTFKSTFSGRG